MKSDKRPFFVLFISPVLITIQFIIGFYLVQTIVRVNESENAKSKLETYLRNNLVYLINAETGQRGYLLTGDLKYLEPYNTALEKVKANDAFLLSFADSAELRQLKDMKREAENKLDELALTIRLSESGKRDSAMLVVKSDFGKLTMDSIRGITNDFLVKANESIADAQAFEYKLIYIFIISMIVLLVFHLFFWYYGYRVFKNYTDSIIALVDELKQSNLYSEQFAYISAHDLKSPIIAIQGLVEVLTNANAIKEDYTGVVTRLKRTVTEMQRTNHALNNILRLRQNLLRRENIANEYASLKTILKEVVEALQSDIQLAGAHVDTDLDGLADMSLPYVHFKSVFHNVISNSIKYRNPLTPLQVKVNAAYIDAESVVFTVKDNGLGMDIAQNKDKMFGIFKRFHDHVEGQGIGLHIVKSIIDAYKGSIDVNSEPGKGMEFKIVLNRNIIAQYGNKKDTVS